MASLVADYGTSSDSESDSDQVHNDLASKSKPPVNPVSSADFFGTTGDDGTSDSDGEEDKEKAIFTREESQKERLPNPLLLDQKLPNPLLGGAGLPSTASVTENTVQVKSSVFLNPFQKAEEAKHSILEQHVKMTAAQTSSDAKGKKICWNFRRGRCRFGHKCKYAHDNDIQNSGSVGDTDQQRQSSQPGHQSSYYGDQSWQQTIETTDANEDDDSYMAQAKRKKRAGISDALVPPKKALKALDHQRAQERPWTMQK